jgi:hypothetical protein
MIELSQKVIFEENKQFKQNPKLTFSSLLLSACLLNKKAVDATTK